MNRNDFTAVSPSGEIVYITASIGNGLAGIAFPDPERSITIDGRQRGKEKLDTFIHECLHVVYPDEDESSVCAGANFIAEVLWKAGYRRISEKK